MVSQKQTTSRRHFSSLAWHWTFVCSRLTRNFPIRSLRVLEYLRFARDGSSFRGFFLPSFTFVTRRTPNTLRSVVHIVFGRSVEIHSRATSIYHPMLNIQLHTFYPVNENNILPRNAIDNTGIEKSD